MRTYGLHISGIIAIVAAGAALALTSCGRKPSRAPNAVAQVGSVIITQEAFEAELDRRAKNGQPTRSPTDREAILDNMIRLEVFFAKGQAAGYDRDPETLLQFKKLVAAKFEQDQWNDQPHSPKPDDHEIDYYYHNHREQFTSPEKVRVAVLYLRVSGKAGPDQIASAEKRAHALREQALEQQAKQTDFGLLALDHSDDQTTRYRGGDCGFLTRGSGKVNWHHGVREATFALRQAGEVSPIVRAPEGFYLFKLIERKEAQVASLGEVREQIAKQLTTSAEGRIRKEFEVAQRQGFNIEINRELLHEITGPPVVVETATATPPGMPSHSN